MSATAKAIPSPKKVKRKSWSKRTEVDGVTNSVEVEELDNGGYLVRVNKYGEDKKGKYHDITNKYYSDNNPLEAEDKGTAEALHNILMRKNNNTLV